MKSPELRFKTESGLNFPELNKKQLSEIMVQRKEKSCITEDLPLLSFTIEQGVIDPSEKKTNKRDFLTKDMKSKKYLIVEYNDIIYNPSNIIYGAIDRNNFRRGVVSPIYAVFKTSECSEYMGLLVSSRKFINETLKYLEGSVIKLRTLKPEAFLQIEVNIPCMKEQEKIAEFFSALDQVIDKTQSEIYAWEKQKRGVMQLLFSRKVRFKADDGSEFPEWEEKTLGECCECLDSMRIPVKKIDRTPGLYPYYGSTNIQDYVDGYLFDEPLVLLAEDAGPFDDFATKPIAQFIDGKCWVNNHAHVLRPKDNVKYVFYALEHKDIRMFINSPGRGKLNQEDMIKITIPYPNSAEQQKIAACLSGFDDVIDKAKKELEAYRELKKGLLQQMFV